MAYIQSVSTHTPPYRYSTQKITEMAGSWLKDTPQEQALFERLAGSTKIEHRSFALPIEDLLALRGQAERAKIFKEMGASLLQQVIKKGLDTARVLGQSVGALLTTSCSVPTIPAIDASVMGDIGLSPSVLRLPIFQYGCAGGAIGLALANHLTPSVGTAVLASVELCSLVYQGDDHQAGNIVGSAIFGDGAACVIISQKPGPLRILHSRSFLIPDTYDLMGYDILDDGTHLRLDREIPQALLRAAPRAINDTLSEASLSRSDISWWLFHPGGAKILASLEDELDVSREQSRWSWESLRDHGNMSSASILFALEGFLRERVYAPGDKVLMLGVGPGLTLQVNLFECCA